MIDLANICLEADNEKRLMQFKDVVVRSIDTITLLGGADQQIRTQRLIENISIRGL